MREVHFIRHYSALSSERRRRGAGVRIGGARGVWNEADRNAGTRGGWAGFGLIGKESLSMSSSFVNGIRSEPTSVAPKLENFVPLRSPSHDSRRAILRVYGE